MAKAAKAATNGFDPHAVQSLVGKIEDYFVDIESERGSYMQRCRSIRDSISAVYDEAEARGVPKKELRVLVKARAKMKSARALLDDIEPEQRETVEMLAQAFGDAADLPLFAEKIKRTGAAHAGADAH